MLNEEHVSDHYSSTPLLTAITQGLKKLGKTPDNVTPEDFLAIEEFHIGGRSASKNLLDQLNLSEDSHILDIGCGIGGASRFTANHYQANITGIDLTSEYIETGRALCSWLGLDKQIHLHHGSALSMPFDDQSFDAAYMMHVGMNIDNKKQLFSEVNRLLRTHSLFGIYDVMITGEGQLNFPVPWAKTPDINALSHVNQYKNILQSVGFDIIAEQNRQDFALDFFAEQQARLSGLKEMPVLGLHLVMGETTSIKMKNVVEAIASGYIAPVELIVKKN